ncbi:replication factor C subunit 3-like isoform X2 [Elaeis guineensis]|uniref:replication factor C subunit 3-like isoform X2 n=1 Tax=Elaeis guineensis var. tenera TaxID=51953 RepID=UPI003C6D6405
MAEAAAPMEIDCDTPPARPNKGAPSAPTASPPPGLRSTAPDLSPTLQPTMISSTPVTPLRSFCFFLGSVLWLMDFFFFFLLLLQVDRLTNENRLPHLLLYGPPGSGKTSTILAVARKLYGEQYHNMILVLNASDDRGIDVVRQQIQDFASPRSPSFGAKSSVKLVLLDEADAMTKDAQFALRRVIEKHAKSTRFALICNHVNKIIPALQSRCTRFRFAPLDATHIRERLEYVIKVDGLDVAESGLTALVRLSNGDMRKALKSEHIADYFPLVPINTYGFSTCDRRSCLPLHWKPNVQRY